MLFIFQRVSRISPKISSSFGGMYSSSSFPPSSSPSFLDLFFRYKKEATPLSPIFTDLKVKSFHPFSRLIKPRGSQLSFSRFFSLSSGETSLVDSGTEETEKFKGKEVEVEETEESSFQYELPPVTIVDDLNAAQRVVKELRELRGKKFFHACDTEVIDIDLSDQSPVGHGICICFSIFVGPDFDFGGGPRIWVDTHNKPEILQAFKEYFEDATIQKVWHNYSFDRHILNNHGINVSGFAADTLHMARLWDSARLQKGGYSLQALTEELLPEGSQKRSMSDRFAAPIIKKDGNPGKAMVMPTIEELQTNFKYRNEWIDYSTLDTESTWMLREILELKLKSMKWRPQETTMYDFYCKYFVPFGELLCDIERLGMRVDVEKLKQMEGKAEADIIRSEVLFKEWASEFCPDAIHMNVNSVSQKQQLLFAPTLNKRTGEELPREKSFKIDNAELLIEEGKTKPKKTRDITISGIGLSPLSFTAVGWPAVGIDVLQQLAGKIDHHPPKYGTAFQHFENSREGERACRAIGALCEVGTISTLVNTFIKPLQQMADKNGRIHASLNINTETGRLSCRKPNLQNQPALEKDRYKIRSTFVAEPGKKLIVADYGQLELRLLAHITKCRSMIDAFKQGGDFHSRTAMGMYPIVSDAVKQGSVLLEWDSSQGEAPAPLLKDVFASERRKAKVLNFSIAYGKTAHGLAKDWSVSMEEANETLQRWYSDRPEVREWQAETIRIARQTGYTRTILGRYRHLPDITSSNRAFKGHAERAAINTPLQGSAADVAMLAMLKLHFHPRLHHLGWKMIMQIHDELIFEGPEETTQEGLEIIMNEMKSPLEEPLLVDLVVDASIADNWMEGK